MCKEILVIGSINMDLVFKIPRLPHKGESLPVADFFLSAGGKGANQALAVSKLGGKVKYIGKVGSDSWGERLKNVLLEKGVKTDWVSVSVESHTGLAVVLVDSDGNNRIVVAKGANQQLTIEDIKKYLFMQEQYAAILLQLEIPLPTVQLVIQYARRLKIPVIVDAGPTIQCELSLFEGVEIISPNQIELSSLLGRAISGLKEIKIAVKELRDRTKAGKVILKMGSTGALLYDDHGYKFFEAFPVTVQDTTAAGDGFTAALVVGFVQGWSLEKMIQYANAVGAMVVSRKGAYDSIPSQVEVANFLQKQGVSL